MCGCKFVKHFVISLIPYCKMLDKLTRLSMLHFYCYLTVASRKKVANKKKPNLMTACDAKEIVESIDYCTGKGCKLHIYTIFCISFELFFYFNLHFNYNFNV